MAIEHTVLVTAPSGNIGSALLPLLLSDPTLKLICPTSNASHLQSTLPTTTTNANIVIEEGSIRDPVWLQSLLTAHAVDTVFLCLTGTDELLTTLNFFDAMSRAATVQHLVYLSACGDFVSEEGVKRVMRVCSAAHVVVKSTLETKLKHAAFPWTSTVVGPTIFFSNDLRSKEAMLGMGVFAEPLGEAGVSRVSTSDIATVIHHLVVAGPGGRFAGQKIQVGSLRTYTGSETARLWSRAIGKEVGMWGSDEEGMGEFEKGFRQMAGGDGAWPRDIRLMYETFAHQAFGMSEEEYEVQCRVLGKEPEDYERWVEETARGW